LVQSVRRRHTSDAPLCLNSVEEALEEALSTLNLVGLLKLCLVISLPPCRNFCEHRSRDIAEWVEIDKIDRVEEFMKEPYAQRNIT
jgi:hypothetical protein